MNANAMGAIRPKSTPPTAICGRFWRVSTDEFAPEIKPGELVLLSAEAEPAPGDVVAVPAPGGRGFRLARFALGGAALAVVAAVANPRILGGKGEAAAQGGQNGRP